jgi:hypothetical protein
MHRTPASTVPPALPSVSSVCSVDWMAEAHAEAFRSSVPTDECQLSPSGRLLTGSMARYDTMAEYVQQFGGPTSGLPGLGYWTFHDPLWPDLTLLVRTRPRERCDDCGHPLDHCECTE